MIFKKQKATRQVSYVTDGIEALKSSISDNSLAPMTSENDSVIRNT